MSRSYGWKPVQKHLFWVCLLSLSWSKIVVSWWIRRRMIKCRKSFGKSCAFFTLSRWVFPKLVSVSYLERFEKRQYIISVNCIWIFHNSYIHNWTINISSVIYMIHVIFIFYEAFLRYCLGSCGQQVVRKKTFGDAIFPWFSVFVPRSSEARIERTSSSRCWNVGGVILCFF